MQTGTLADALRGADIFVGVSAPNIVTSGNGFFHEQRRHPVCHGKSGAGDHAGCGQSCRSKSCRNRTERFPKSGKQCDRFPWYFPRCIWKGTCHPDHRRNETCSSRSTLQPLYSDEELNEDFIMPEAFDPRVAEVVSEAVKSHVR